MYYSLLAVSSGDTVARETALLGVPTVYTGGRDMEINRPLIEEGALFASNNIKEIEDYILMPMLLRKMRSEIKS